MNVLSYHFERDPNEFTADPMREARGLAVGMVIAGAVWLAAALVIALWIFG